MKVNRRKKGKFLNLLIRNYIAFTLGILISFFTILIISVVIIYANMLNWENSTPEKYINILKNGDYSNFPIKSLFGDGSSIIILNSEGKILFSSTKDESSNYTQQEIECIPNYNKGENVSIEKYIDYKGEERIVVSRSISNLNNQKYEDLWIFDNKLNLIYSTEKTNIKTFTQKEFDYLTMKSFDNKVVMKYQYYNHDKLNTMIIKTANLQDSTISKAIKPFKYVLYILLITYLIIILLFIKWLNNKVKKPLKLLNEAIVNFSEGNKDLQMVYSGPEEFVEIFDSFEKMANKLKKTEVRNEKLQQEKQKMLADISHDLKTPITVIQAYSKAICDGIIKGEDEKKYLMTIYKKSEILTELINEFNQFNRVDHPEFSLNIKTSDLCEFARNYLIEIYDEIELYQFTLEIDIPDEVLNCNFDDFYLKRALDNIIFNSLKHNPKGTSLFFTIFKFNENIKIIIADNGVGIPSELAKNIFEPFVVGDESRSKNGSGLGLSISKKIILRHNGSIKLIKETKRGITTEFEILLPGAKGEKHV
ncbi:MAG: sensor histidine kinase [Sarcina sp.]